jgi:catechol-2,3-dioxygenase
MLGNAAVTTILPVQDLDRARAFYETKLGLTPKGTLPNGQFLFDTGTRSALALFQKPDAKPSETTALSFEVSDIMDAVGDLERRGVRFEDYDLPNLKTVDHVCVLGSEKAAWFRDTEGNILCLHEDLTQH